jgi:membrane associated rhomboid family serine protease
MLVRALVALAVGVVTFLIALFVLGLLTLPTSPWAALLGLVAGVVYFASGHTLSKV